MTVSERAWKQKQRVRCHNPNLIIQQRDLTQIPIERKQFMCSCGFKANYEVIRCPICNK